MIKSLGSGDLRIFYPVCDQCKEPDDTKKTYPSFIEAVRHKQKHNWRSRLKDNGKWEDFCPYCKRFNFKW